MPPESDWRPRPDDHLVEPFLGGLGGAESLDDEPDRSVRPQRSAARRWLRRLAILAVSLVLAVALFEFAIRVADPLGTSHFLDMQRYGAEVMEIRPESERLILQRPDLDVAMHGWRLRTDRFGLRGPERPHPKPAGLRRYLFLGDSVTLGWGVRERDTFVARLEHAFAESGASAEAINAGHLHHDTTQELALLRDIGFGYEPDVVCLVWCGNDTLLTKDGWGKPVTPNADPDVTAELRHQQQFKRRLDRLKPLLPSSVTFVGHVYSRHRTAKFRRARGDRPLDIQSLGADRTAGWAAAQEAILAMQAECLERGAEFCVLSSDTAEELLEFCAEAGVRCAPIRPSEEEFSQGLRNSHSDPHLNGTGNAILARNAEAALREFGLWPDADAAAR